MRLSGWRALAVVGGVGAFAAASYA